MTLWDRFAKPDCFPDKCQCEYARDALIRQPSAFWSSVAYLVMAFTLWKYIEHKSLQLRLWTGICVLMGVSSMFGHGSFTKFALAFDFAAIILVISFFALLNFLLLMKQSPARILVYLSGFYIALFFMMYSMNKWAKIGICVLIFFFAIGDLIREMGKKFFEARALHISIAVLAVSFALFLLDEFHIDCDPYHWFQWHSVWHVGTAIAMFFYGKWRFDEMASR